MTTSYLSRRHLLRSFSAGIAATSVGSLAWSQTRSDPLEVVRVISGFPPGSSSDVMSRSIAERLARDGYAKAAFVENKTGAGAQIAVQYVKDQAPDGKTLLQTPMSMLGIYPHTYKRLAYDPVADVSPVSLACTFDFSVAVGPSVPVSVTDIAGLLQWYKATPTRASFGSPAAGASPHFIGVLLGRAGGVELTHIPYRGTLPAIQDVIGGQLAAVFGPLGDLNRFKSTSGYRLLGTTGAERSRFSPEIPTFVEQGYKDFVFSEWYGIFMPPRSTPPVLERANAAVRAAVANPDAIKTFEAMGLEAKSSSPRELAELLRRDTARWGPIVQSVGFSAEN